MSSSGSSKKKKELTSQQLAAVQAPLGPVMVIAGAGSGKTAVIAERFVYLHTNWGIDPRRILCVTFTKKAVANMKERICDCMTIEMNNKYRDNIQVLTFHGLCKQILIDVAENGTGVAKKCLSISKTATIVKEILKDYENINASYEVGKLLSGLRWICKSQNRAFTEEDLIDLGLRHTDLLDAERIRKKFPFDDMQEIYRKFDEVLTKTNTMTIDDIILDAREYLMEKGVMDKWSAKFDAILCDEFQDVDAVQFDILTRLCIDDNNLFCVGDPDQSIYGFRGAVPKVFERLKNYFDGLGIETNIKKLEKNFRSTPQILDVANSLINSSSAANIFRKELFTDKPSGKKPIIDVLNSYTKQAEIVVRRIKELQDEGVKLSKMIVLGRNKSHYKHIKSAFFNSSIHFDDWKEVFSLINHMEIKDLIYWINVAFEREDPKKFFKYLWRVFNKPKIGVGPATLRELHERGVENFMKQMHEQRKWNAKLDFLYRKIKCLQKIADDTSMSIHDRCWEIARKSGIWDHYAHEKNTVKWDRLDTMQKFLDSNIILESNTWKEALTHIEKFLDDDDDQDRLVCSTIHGVKGLEFDHVFLVSLSQGNLPSKRGMRLCKNEEQIEDYISEERRLMYVACTRAKETLHLFTNKPIESWSPFLNDITENIQLGIEDIRDLETTIIEEESELFPDDEKFDLFDE